jgi:hypothetical protein
MRASVDSELARGFNLLRAQSLVVKLARGFPRSDTSFYAAEGLQSVPKVGPVRPLSGNGRFLREAAGWD